MLWLLMHPYILILNISPGIVDCAVTLLIALNVGGLLFVTIWMEVCCWTMSQTLSVISLNLYVGGLQNKDSRKKYILMP